MSRTYPLQRREAIEESTQSTGEATRSDQLEYLADLALELKEIADNLGCATLAGVLVVAYREAMIRAHEN